VPNSLVFQNGPKPTLDLLQQGFLWRDSSVVEAARELVQGIRWQKRGRATRAFPFTEAIMPVLASCQPRSQNSRKPGRVENKPPSHIHPRL
jgi:hypothetical protein